MDSGERPVALFAAYRTAQPPSLPPLVPFELCVFSVCLFIYFVEVARGSELTSATQPRNINGPKAHNAALLLRSRAALFELKSRLPPF